MSTAPAPTSNHSPHQRVGWIELFYDLVFVVVIEQLTHLVHDDPSRGRIWLTIGLTFVVWMAWFNVSALTNASGEIGPRGRPLFFLSMAGMGVLALGIEGVPHGHVGLFVIGYVIARTAIWVLWMRHRPLSWTAWRRPLLHGPVLSLLWLLTALVHDQRHLLFAFIALSLAEGALPFVRQQQGENQVIHGPHMVERIGLLLMIVLGESVVQIVQALEGERTVGMWVAAALAMCLLCSLWWLIYDATVSKLEAAVERDDTSISDFIGGSQLGIITGLILVAAGLSNAIHSANGEHHGAHLPHGSLACLCLGLLMVQLGVTSLSRRAFAINLGFARREPRHRSKEEARAQRQELRAQRTRHKDDAHGSARRSSELVHWVTFLAPILVLWRFGDHWPAWLVLVLLFGYVATETLTQSRGEQRIRAYIEAGGFVPGRMTSSVPATGATVADPTPPDTEASGG